jgi:hypothetical protein
MAEQQVLTPRVRICIGTLRDLLREHKEREHVVPRVTQIG